MKPTDIVDKQTLRTDIPKVGPGDEVLVHGAEIRVPYGETHEERRKATIKRATWFEQAWVRMTGDLEYMELLEFSFSGEDL